jgi:RNA-directed DNA polymerase
MRETIRKTNLRHRTQITLEDVANEINPLLRGWIEYYGRYCPSALYPVFRHVNRTLVAWAMRKYKRLAGHRTRASASLESPSENFMRDYRAFGA